MSNCKMVQILDAETSKNCTCLSTTFGFWIASEIETFCPDLGCWEKTMVWKCVNWFWSGVNKEMAINDRKFNEFKRRKNFRRRLVNNLV